MRLILTAPFLALLLPFQVTGRTYIVASSGGDYATIKLCAAAAQPGDTCLVSAGTYDEHVTTVRGGTSDTVRITFLANGAVSMHGFDIRHPYVTVNGFGISGYATQYSGQIYTTAAANYCKILNNTIDAPGTVHVSGIYIYGSDSGPTGCTVEGNTVSHQTYPFLQLYGSGHTVQNNTFQYQDSEDFVRPFGSNLVIRRNIFRIGSEVLSSGQHPDVVQTFALAGDGITIANNLFEENWVQDLSAYRTDLSATSNNVVHSASRTFTSDDVLAYIRVVGGTGWTPGLYKITSISGGDAVLNGNVGTAPLSGGLWWFAGSQMMQLNSSVSGTGLPSSKVYNMTFRRNVFVNIPYSANNSIPGVRFENNTFYLAAWSGSGLGFGSVGMTRGASDHAYVVGNAFVSGGSGGSTAGYYSMLGQELNEETIYEMVTLEPAGAHPFATGIYNNFFANGYLVGNASPTASAKALTDISQLVWTLDSSYDSYKSGAYTILTGTATQDTAARATFRASKNYVYPAKATGPCESPDGGTTFYQFSTSNKWCEGNSALNGTNGQFRDLTNPLGPDGIPFTLDDGLKPAPTSPLCGAGDGGTDIGAYSCDSTKVFADPKGVQAPTNLTVTVE